MCSQLSVLGITQLLLIALLLLDEHQNAQLIEPMLISTNLIHKSIKSLTVPDITQLKPPTHDKSQLNFKLTCFEMLLEFPCLIRKYLFIFNLI